MKIAKVTIQKDRLGSMTSFIYPASYNPTAISPFIYEDANKETEICLAIVKDNYTFGTGIEEITVEQSDALIEDIVNNHKDYTDAYLASAGKTKADIIAEEKAKLYQYIS